MIYPFLYAPLKNIKIINIISQEHWRKKTEKEASTNTSLDLILYLWIF
jgi:hypothetical protein